jgi:hypothetical protein
MRSLVQSARFKTIGATFCLIACLAASPIEVVPPAYALPAGYFHLRGTVRDNYGGGSLRSMDATSADGKVTGYVRLNTTGYAKDALLWKEIFPRTGTMGFIKLQNKLTGQCIAMPSDNTGNVTLRPCTDQTAVWEKIVMGENRAAFRRTQRVVGPFLDDFIDCLAKDAKRPGQLVIMPCNNGFTPEMVWEAYVSG